MPIQAEHLQEMEEVVADAVRRAREDAERNGALRQFFADLKKASASLYELGAGNNCSYALASMGEAYALWYHMRRVAQIYEALDGSKAAESARWTPQWRMLDVGAGTGAGMMALTRWLHDHGLTGAVATASVTCLEPATPMRETGERIGRAFTRRLGGRTVAQEWVLQRFGANVWLDARYNLILFSTTFDFVPADQEEEIQRAAAEFVLSHLAPRGAVLVLAPNVGYDGVNSGPKARFANGFVAAMEARGLTRYNRPPIRRRHHEASVQRVILDVRCELYHQALGQDPPIQLYRDRPDKLPANEQPRYQDDVFSFGGWIGE